MNNNKEGGGISCKTYVAAGAINIENIEKVENLFPGNEEMIKAVMGAKREGEYDKNLDILSQIKGVFFGNEEVAKQFLMEIDNAKPTQVVAIVGEYLSRKEISQISCHRDLWALLHENGYYDPSESNWNKAIRRQ